MTFLASKQLGPAVVYLDTGNVLRSGKVLGSSVTLALAGIVNKVFCDLTQGTTFLADWNMKKKSQREEQRLLSAVALEK